MGVEAVACMVYDKVVELNGIIVGVNDLGKDIIKLDIIDKNTGVCFNSGLEVFRVNIDKRYINILPVRDKRHRANVFDTKSKMWLSMGINDSRRGIINISNVKGLFVASLMEDEDKNKVIIFNEDFSIYNDSFDYVDIENVGIKGGIAELTVLKNLTQEFCRVKLDIKTLREVR